MIIKYFIFEKNILNKSFIDVLKKLLGTNKNRLIKYNMKLVNPKTISQLSI